MGEVRVMVRLSNAADMALVRRNLMRPEEIQTVEADALVDTGAVTLVLPSLVVERLGLARPFKQVAEYADGRREEVDVTEPVFVELLGRHTVEEALVLGMKSSSDKPFSKKPTSMSIVVKNACYQTPPTLTSRSCRSNR